MKTKIFIGFLFVLVLSVQIIAQNKSVQGAVYNKIAFTRSQSQSDWDIWIMNWDGSGEVKLADNTYRDTNPHFNPQGTGIVFARITSQQPMQSDIYVMDPDGSNQTNLTNIGTLTQPCVGPHFSWDGTKIAFDVTAAPGNGDLWIMNSDGTGHTAVLATNGDDSSPTFSPDGQWLVFQRKVANDPNPKSKICKVKISDGTVVDLTDGSDLDETPVYSTDGQYILFKRGFTVWDLYRMPHDHNPANNQDIINMTNQPAMPAGTANYSWEGDKIVYYTGQLAPETSEIYVMNTDGTGNTKITNNNVADWDPSFSPAQSVSAPEINIKGNDTDIVNSDTTPSSSDHTDFGSTPIDGSTITRTFTIENKGTANLLLNGNPIVQITGTGASDFSVTLLPSSTISAGESTTFQIKFDPSASGARTATVAIPNNDSDENPYTFTIQGTGSSATASVYNKIAFTRQESTSDWDIWIMDRDGSNQQQLLNSSDKDMNPHFSYDGKYIAFTRNSGSPPNLIIDTYVMNSDGTNVRNLSEDITENCTGPKFSWDGEKIAFFRNMTGTGNVLCIMNSDGSNKQYINDLSGNPIVGDSPFFTPDGQWIVFVRIDTQNQQGAVYKVPITGGNVTQLTNASDFDELPRVSPDGQFVICKYAPVAGGKSDIAKFSINQTPQTSTITNLTNTSTEDEDSPMYSPEGDKIVYMGTTAGSTMEIFVMNSDGSGTTRLTNNSVQDFDPTFSPAQIVAPEINLKGNSQNILNGDSTPNTADHTDFGNALVDGETITRTFTIENTGNANLILTGNPLVQLSGTNSSDFSVTSNPTSTILPGNSTTFQIRFDPSATGLRTTAVSIPNNDSDESPYTFSIQGTGTISAPNPPTLSTPSNGAINVTINITLTWNSSPNAESYQLQVSSATNFSTTVINQSGLTTNSFNLTGLLNNTTYYWRVNASNAGGTSGWSEIRSFTTIVALPEKVTLLSPDNNQVISTLNVTLQWNASNSQVDRYWLEIADNINLLNPIVDENITSTEKSFQAEANKSYWWKIKAHNIAGWGEFSNTYKFTIGIAPSIITLLAPANGETNCATTLDLSWNTVANVSFYQLQLSTTESFSNLIIDDANLTTPSKNVTSLSNNQIYYWRVRGINQFGNGPWSITFTFTTIVALPDKVVLLTPENNSTMSSNSVSLSWNTSNPQVDKYWLEIADNINMNNPIVDQNITTTEKPFQTEANKSFWWKVKAHNVAGWGEFSEIWKFNSMTVDVKDETIPTNTELFQNYPNPFNAGTEISFNIAEQSFISLTIYNILGKEINIITNKEYSPGRYKINWNPESIPTGVYFCQLKTEIYSRLIKILYLK
jgi:Tol biopolymer transport system component